MANRIPSTLSVLFFWAACTFAPHAMAFCQANTCSSTESGCSKDRDTACKTGGVGVRWRRDCVPFSVAMDGSPKLGIDATELEEVLLDAKDEWEKAECDDGTMSLELLSLGPVACASAEFNADAANANIWIFRDDAWPHDEASGAGDEVAYSTLTYDLTSGELLDVDVEINSAHFDIGLEPHEGGYDLRSVVTHEMGHFLGLDHSQDADAVMASPLPLGKTRHRLHTDDVQGICALYGDRQPESSCAPEGGFSELCRSEQTLLAEDANSNGCNIRAPHRTMWHGLALVVLSLVSIARQRNRHRVSPSGGKGAKP